MVQFGIIRNLSLSVLAVICVHKVAAFPSDASKCHCVLLKNCDSFTSFIDRSNDISLLTATIHEAICNFDGSNIYVCCPKKTYQKRHTKVKTQLDYLDELSGLNCPPSFGKEYDYDAYLKEHEADVGDSDSEEDDAKHSAERESDENTREYHGIIMCDYWGNCGRFKFPNDDAHSFHKPSPTYNQNHDDHYHDHGHDHVFDAPLFPFHHHHQHQHQHQHHHYHHHHHNHPDAPSQFTPYEVKQTKNSETCGSLAKDTIQVMSSDVYPWITRLAYLNTTSRTIRLRCLGTIITDKHVLTAAHCVDRLVKDLRLIYVRIGDDMSFEDFKIIETLIHPNYNEPLFNNDVALIRLAKTRSSKVPLVSICLPQNDSDVSMGNNGIVAGWSENGMSNVASASIRYINLPVMDNTECAIRYAKYSENFENSIVITPREFCAQAAAMNDVCEGDSGGPFMERSTSGSYTLLGIVAFGPKTNCGQSNLPGVYMRVSSFVEWIQSNIV